VSRAKINKQPIGCDAQLTRIGKCPAGMSARGLVRVKFGRKCLGKYADSHAWLRVSTCSVTISAPVVNTQTHRLLSTRYPISSARSAETDCNLSVLSCWQTAYIFTLL